MRASYVNDGTTQTITVVLDDGTPHIIDSTHRNFDRVRSAYQAGDGGALLNALDVFGAVREELAVNGITYTSPTEPVLVDGIPLDATLTKVLLATIESGDDGSALLAFAKRLAKNPSRKSREQLYSFIDVNDLTINDEGYIIGYKGVTTEAGNYVSISRGPGNVDGVEYKNDRLPNNVGSVVTLDRRLVDDDSGRGCSVGLHVGTYEYASNFGDGATLTVKVDPQDVVSVPHDCSFQKVRVCRYEVLATTEAKYLGAVWDGVNHEYRVSNDNVDIDDDFWEGDGWDGSI
jgi:hypothetical protein